MDWDLFTLIIESLIGTILYPFKYFITEPNAGMYLGIACIVVYFKSNSNLGDKICSKERLRPYEKRKPKSVHKNYLKNRWRRKRRR